MSSRSSHHDVCVTPRLEHPQVARQNPPNHLVIGDHRQVSDVMLHHEPGCRGRGRPGAAGDSSGNVSHTTRCISSSTRMVFFTSDTRMGVGFSIHLIALRVERRLACSHGEVRLARTFGRGTTSKGALST